MGRARVDPHSKKRIKVVAPLNHQAVALRHEREDDRPLRPCSRGWRTIKERRPRLRMSLEGLHKAIFRTKSIRTTGPQHQRGSLNQRRSGRQCQV